MVDTRDAGSALTPIGLRVDGEAGPLGIDESPRLSWRLDGHGRGRTQRAYELRVVRGLGGADGDVVWDTGVVASAATGTRYAGAPLEPRSQYRWWVRVTDGDGRVSAWSEPGWFETGLLDASAWAAGWIAAAEQPESVRWPILDNVPRIRPVTSGDQTAEQGVFRTRFTVPRGVTPLAARLVVGGAAEIHVALNGRPVTAEILGEKGAVALRADVTDLLTRGENVLAVHARADRADRPLGLVARLEVASAAAPPSPEEIADAGQAPVSVMTGGRWLARADVPAGWMLPDLDDTSWPRAEQVGLHEDPPWGREVLMERPSPYLRRELHLTGGVARARLYATALGVYELTLNGRRVGTDRLAPGWTDYHQRVPYQVYDVTDLLRAGDNALGAVLADGWYAGHICWFGLFQYGSQLAFRAELEVTYEDGTVTRTVTDGSWRTGEGATRYADLQLGETTDARWEPDGWTLPGFDDSAWQPARVVHPPHGRLVAQVAPPIRVLHQLLARSATEVRPGTWMVDFGQNLVGWARLTVDAEPGRRIVLRHGEALGHDGTLHVANLRSARQTDVHVCRGGREVIEPRFTVHGFRYLEVTGWPGVLDPAVVSAQVVSADMAPSGEFACSDERLNRLQRNILWGQRGNFLSVPTDCPQRDERLGWTGDAQVFAATAAFNMDVSGFFRKWLTDLADAQRPDGEVPWVVPDAITRYRPGRSGGTAGWGDAVVIVPWVLYQAYGDPRIIRESYQPMRRWLAYCQQHSTGLIRPAEGFGDWLSVDADTPKDLIATAFFAWSARLFGELASVLGHDQDARWAAELSARIRAAFRDRFVDGGGVVAGGTQTAYVLALRFGLLESEEVPAAAGRLVADIQARNDHLSTGFLGTPHLLGVLTDAGWLEVAYRLLTQDTYPSWLYPIVRWDATTIWERWDSQCDHRGLQSPDTKAMNSFNHYAYGAVGEWLYRTVAGIAPGTPGYTQVVVRPRPGGGLTWARGALETPGGRVAVAWERSGDSFILEVELPVGTGGQVWVPTTDPAAVTEGGLPVATAEGVRVAPARDGCAVFTVGSGHYRFGAPLSLPAGSSSVVC